MCRLLGVVSATPISVADAVGERRAEGLRRADEDPRRRLGRRGRVGRPVDEPEVEVSAGSALDDPHFAAATHDQRSAASLVHLRWATSGLAVQPQNSHPFSPTAWPWRTTAPSNRSGPLEELLEPEIAATLHGTTDSERYFAVIRQHRRSAPDLARGGPAGGRPAARALSRRQPQRADPRRGSADRRARARPQPAARRGHRGDHRGGSARRAPRGLLRACGWRASRRRHGGDRVDRLRRSRLAAAAAGVRRRRSRCTTCRYRCIHS